MADQIPDYDEAQIDINAMQADIDVTDTEVVEEEEDSDGVAQFDRRLPERLLWCFACHQKGHRAQECTSIPPNAPQQDTWDLLNMRRLDPISNNDDWPSAQKLLNMITTCTVACTEMTQHIHRRDALLSVIYDEMMNWQAPLPHETWFHFMSMFHLIVDDHEDRMNTILKRLLRPPFEDYALCTDTAVSCFRRIREFYVGHVDLEEAVEAINADLVSTQENFAERFTIFIADLEEYLESSPEVLSLYPADSAWLVKAFWVMVVVQPFLDLSDVFIVRWTYQDIDDVVAAEGLEI